MGPRAGLLHLMATTRAQLSRAGKLRPNLAAHVEMQHPGCGKAMKSSFSSHNLEHGVAITPPASPAAPQGAHALCKSFGCVAQAW